LRKLIYQFNVSTDGYLAAPGDDIGWTSPSEELHQFYNDFMAGFDVVLYGRKIYELMEPYWPTAGDAPDASPIEVEYSRLYRGIEKVVFSRTLKSVTGNSRLATGDVRSEVERLKAQPGKDIGVGGATLAAECIREGLVDEYGMCVYPVILGGGTPFFPHLDQRIPLRLLETRAFPGGVTWLHYAAG
jgi:dihydrofolate reductase